jgi:hypothetical protein
MLDTDTLDQQLPDADINLLAFAFLTDSSGVKSDYLRGLVQSLWEMYSANYQDQKGFMFVRRELGGAVFCAEGIAGKDVMVPFVRDIEDGHYRVDLAAMLVFSRHISAQRIYQLGMRSLEMNRTKLAVEFFELCSDLRPVYDRLRVLVWDHFMVGAAVVPERRAEIAADFRYIAIAEQQAELLVMSEPLSVPVDMNRFLPEVFRGYQDIPSTSISEADRQVLIELPEAELRKSLADLLVGVDPVVAQREASKPHSGYEISDIDVVIRYRERDFNLSIPVKSGMEMVNRQSVPIDVFHQLIRPHMSFQESQSITVFVTAKRCSQPLLNFIRVANDRFGTKIAVIEADDLVKLLKANGKLST